MLNSRLLKKYLFLTKWVADFFFPDRYTFGGKTVNAVRTLCSTIRRWEFFTTNNFCLFQSSEESSNPQNVSSNPQNAFEHQSSKTKTSANTALISYHQYLRCSDEDWENSKELNKHQERVHLSEILKFHLYFASCNYSSRQ